MSDTVARYCSVLFFCISLNGVKFINTKLRTNQSSFLANGAIGGAVIGSIAGGIIGSSNEALASSAMWGLFYGLIAGIAIGSVLHALSYKKSKAN